MITGISENYRELAEAADFDDAWKDPAIPERQYKRVVAAELATFRAGGKVLPFDVLLECLRMLPRLESPSLLDVGASSGYYSEVLKIGGYDCRYQGCDYSPAFVDFASDRYPWLKFEVADAVLLPYGSSSFDIVLHSAVIMHLRYYERAIFEAARVSKRFVILHRTPVEGKQGTRFYQKEAYGTPCLEIHFDPKELLEIFARCGLSIIYETNLFMTESGYGHRSYVLQKDAIVHHQV